MGTYDDTVIVHRDQWKCCKERICGHVGTSLSGPKRHLTPISFFVKKNDGDAKFACERSLLCERRLRGAKFSYNHLFTICTRL